MYIDISHVAKMKPKYHHLFKQLLIIRAKWEVFSDNLGVIVSEKPNDDLTNLSRALKAWLRKEGKKVTWAYLLYVLEDCLEEEAVAKDLRKFLQRQDIVNEYLCP